MAHLVPLLAERYELFGCGCALLGGALEVLKHNGHACRSGSEHSAMAWYW
jgi:hypothetical protein